MYDILTTVCDDVASSWACFESAFSVVLDLSVLFLSAFSDSLEMGSRWIAVRTHSLEKYSTVM